MREINNVFLKKNSGFFTDSWVDLSSSASGPHSPLRVTPVPFGGETDYLRMLQEAQRESTRQLAHKRKKAGKSFHFLF